MRQSGQDQGWTEKSAALPPSQPQEPGLPHGESDAPCCDPDAVPLTREQQLERIIAQYSAEAIERARAYDDANAFYEQRITALRSQYDALFGAAGVVVHFDDRCDATPWYRVKESFVVTGRLIDAIGVLRSTLEAEP